MKREDNYSFIPECDILETKNYFYIFLDVPGVNPEKVDISYRDNKLEIRGEKLKNDLYEGDVKFHRIERYFGKFEVVFDWVLPDVDENSIEATYKDGVLFLKIKRRSEEEENYEK